MFFITHEDGFLRCFNSFKCIKNNGNTIWNFSFTIDDKKTEYNYTQSDVVEAIYFNFDDSSISNDGVLKIQDVAKMVKKSSSLNILVVGNCDKFGTEKYNYDLGRRRADAVRDVFISAGIDKDRIVTASLGSCRANKEILNKSEGKNDRRCDIVLLK